MLNKMTMRNTVTEIINAITDACKNKAVKADKNLMSRMRYTSAALNKGEKIRKADLLDLWNDAFTVIAAAEAKKSEPKQAKPVKESKLKPKSEAKKEAKEVKSEKTKPEPKSKDKVDSKTQKNAKSKDKKPTRKAESKQKGFSFPEEYEDKDGIKYFLADDLNSYDAVKKAVENEEEIVFATYWTKEMLQSGAYGNGQITKKSDMPKLFNDDLDLLQVIYVAESLTNIFTISMYTECEYYFMEKDFKSYVSNNLRFRVYRVEDSE